MGKRKRYEKPPAVSGKQLIRLLQKDGWILHGSVRHGVSLVKATGDRKIVTLVPNTRAALPDGTLAAILGPKQTGMGRQGLLELLDRFGL